MPLALSIIIVQYKTPELLERCISSIYDHTRDISYEVIVVNNDVDDTTKDDFISKFPKLIWLDAGYNSGFSRANNMGIRHATGEYLLILNPDTEIKGDFLRSFIAFYEKNNIDGSLGLLGCRIISSVDQSLLVGSGLGWPSLIKLIRANPLYIRLTRSANNKPSNKYDPYVMHYRNHEIDFVSGACVMIEREKVLKHKLLFDEDFFLYSEDVEWAHRVQKSGFKNFFCAEIEVYHVNSASTGFSKGKFFQLQISSYLYHLKVSGLVGYLLLGLILFFNFTANLFLLKRAGQSEAYLDEKAQYEVFKRYFFFILRKYYFASTATKPYLKYD